MVAVVNSPGLQEQGKWCLRAVLWVLVALGIGSCAGTTAELPKEPVARGKAALERGQLNEAVKALRMANAVEPDNQEVIRLLEFM